MRERSHLGAYATPLMFSLAPGAACTTRSDGPWRRGKVAALLVQRIPTAKTQGRAAHVRQKAPLFLRRLEIRSPAPTIAPTGVPWPVALSVSPAAARPSGEGARGLLALQPSLVAQAPPCLPEARGGQSSLEGLTASAASCQAAMAHMEKTELCRFRC